MAYYASEWVAYFVSESWRTMCRNIRLRVKNCLLQSAKLFTRLYGARADNSLYKEIARIEKQDLLILDDFGLQNLDKPQRDLLMEIIEDRHNKKSTIIASLYPSVPGMIDWIRYYCRCYSGSAGICCPPA